MPSLTIDGWVPTERQGFEAVVFLHGFNTPVADACKLIAQLWTLGDFPAYLKPFVFGWPGGRDLRYLHACKRAHDPALAGDLCAFLHSLADAGCHRMHFVAHSMGARFLLSALPHLSDVLELAPSGRSPRGGAQGGGPRPPKHAAGATSNVEQSVARRMNTRHQICLASTLLMNPDSPLDNFIEDDHANLRRVCDHITLYADHSDGALAWSEILHGQRSLGKNPSALVRKVDGRSLGAQCHRHHRRRRHRRRRHRRRRSRHSRRRSRHSCRLAADDARLAFFARLAAWLAGGAGDADAGARLRGPESPTNPGVYN